jgi:hypothetical protein
MPVTPAWNFAPAFHHCTSAVYGAGSLDFFRLVDDSLAPLRRLYNPHAAFGLLVLRTFGFVLTGQRTEDGTPAGFYDRDIPEFVEVPLPADGLLVGSLLMYLNARGGVEVRWDGVTLSIQTGEGPSIEVFPLSDAQFHLRHNLFGGLPSILGVTAPPVAPYLAAVADDIAPVAARLAVEVANTRSTPSASLAGNSSASRPLAAELAGPDRCPQLAEFLRAWDVALPTPYRRSRVDRPPIGLMIAYALDEHLRDFLAQRRAVFLELATTFTGGLSELDTVTTQLLTGRAAAA